MTVLLLLLSIAQSWGAIVLQDIPLDTAGTNLTAHTPAGAGATGGAYSVHPADNSGGAVFKCDSSNYLYATTAGTYLNAASFAGADCYSSFTYHVYSVIAGQSTGPCLRLDGTVFTCYEARYTVSNHSIELFRFNASAATSLGAVAVTAWVTGENHTIKLSCTGSAISVDYDASVGLISVTDSAPIVSAGKAGIRFSNANAVGTGFHITNITAGDIITNSTAFTMTGPTTGLNNVASTNFTVSLSPVGSTPPTSPTTVTLSDGGAGGSFSAIGTFTFANQSRTFTYTPVSLGPKTISITNDGGLTNPSPLTYMVLKVVAVNDTNVHWSPGNVYVNGSTSARMLNNHSYVKTGFTGTSLTATFDVSILAGTSTPNYPSAYWTVDGLPIQTQQFTSSTTSISLASGLAAGNHRCWMWFYSVNSSIDNWSATPACMAVDCTGFTIDGNANTIAPTNETAVFSDVAIFYGDSIVYGVNVHPLSSWCFTVANALSCECGAIGYPGQGWSSAGSGTVPIFPSSWQFYYQGVSRTFASDPKYIFNNECQNGSVTDATVTQWISDCRAAYATSKILMVVAFSQANATNFKLGVTNYKTAHPGDTKVYTVDVGPGVDQTYGNSGVANYWGSGVHPDSFGSAMLGVKVMLTVDALIGNGASGGGTKRKMQ